MGNILIRCLTKLCQPFAFLFSFFFFLSYQLWYSRYEWCPERGRVAVSKQLHQGVWGWVQCCPARRSCSSRASWLWQLCCCCRCLRDAAAAATAAVLALRLLSMCAPLLLHSARCIILFPRLRPSVFSLYLSLPLHFSSIPSPPTTTTTAAVAAVTASLLFFSLSLSPSLGRTGAAA